MAIEPTIYERIPGEFVIIMPSGNFAQTTACECFVTTSREKADEALVYITQDVTGGRKRAGPHWLKSTFGIF